MKTTRLAPRKSLKRLLESGKIFRQNAGQTEKRDEILSPDRRYSRRPWRARKKKRNAGK